MTTFLACCVPPLSWFQNEIARRAEAQCSTGVAQKVASHGSATGRAVVPGVQFSGAFSFHGGAVEFSNLLPEVREARAEVEVLVLGVQPPLKRIEPDV